MFANCHIKIQPSVTPKFGQLPHLVLKNLLNIIIIHIFEP